MAPAFSQLNKSFSAFLARVIYVAASKHVSISDMSSAPLRNNELSRTFLPHETIYEDSIHDNQSKGCYEYFPYSELGSTHTVV